MRDVFRNVLAAATLSLASLLPAPFNRRGYTLRIAMGAAAAAPKPAFSTTTASATCGW